MYIVIFYNAADGLGAGGQAAYTNRADAEALVALLEKAGFSATIEGGD
jgi:phage replication-related protein YjqB (UPF0714/DUF867 family)